ncbi:Glutamate receptor 2.8 [Acorus gramineus]|uniref:Glutamate receptor n=1 Tax=Acorus gramineus TaxID=55184 RepID=A0AAV9BLW2_ACOGR|nr:Glutamate receptor 2.8 [Acorus gramineus]
MRRLVVILSSLFFFTSLVVDGGPVPFDVGVLLDKGSWKARMSRSCMSVAIDDFYSVHGDYRTRLALHYVDSRGDVVGAASAAVDLLKSKQVHAIIGPQTSSQAVFVSDLGNRSQVPVVSFSATCPSLSSPDNPYFVRTVLSDSFQAPAIAALASAFKWRQLVPIYEDSDYGSGFMPYFVDALRTVDARVPYRCVIPLSASDDRILEELYRLMTMQTRVFVVHASTSLGSRIFAKAAEVGMMSEGYAWVMTTGMTSSLSLVDAAVVENSMQGVLGLKAYVPTQTSEFRDFRKAWKREYLKENPDSDVPELSIVGLRAYDTVWALATAAEKIGGLGSVFKPSSSNDSTDLSSLPVSSNGPNLLNELLKTEFNGLGGKFRLVDRQLALSAFQIVNVIGDGERRIGFWTRAKGLLRHLDRSIGGRAYSASKDDLSPVIWPGESTVVPKDWAPPTSGKKLRLAVPGPVQQGFNSFLQVDWDPFTNGPVVGGFVIDLFEAAVELLPYAIEYEYVPFEHANRTSLGDYDQLAHSVFSKEYDGAVADITIRANRSNHVDFTLPYTDSSVSMVVLLEEQKTKSAWIFLKPLTTDLWVASTAFFVYTGFVVWVIEHRINEQFRGPPTQQLGTVFYFTFSTLVFAHTERVVSNLSRVVVIVWVFVVLILTSSYTASLSSMLTVKQLQPTITSVEQLKANGDYVGYLHHSFVLGLLKKSGFEESKLRPYKSPDEYAEALKKGSRKGGVSAIVDETPYIRLLLSRYCGNFTMVGPIYKAGGFGFAFPKGSPLVPDLSRAILNVTEGDRMVDIERRWLGDETACSDQSNSITSNRLSIASFWGLFLITGIASAAALIIFIALFLYQNRQVLKETKNEGSTLRRLSMMVKRFDEKDPSAHTFRRTETKGEGGTPVVPRSVDASPLRVFDCSGGEGGANVVTARPSSDDVFASPGNDIVGVASSDSDVARDLEMTVVRW